MIVAALRSLKSTLALAQSSTLLALSLSLFAAPPVQASGPYLTPLYSWWSSERQDNFATSDPAWAGTPGNVRSGYAFYRIEGMIIAPSNPQPPDTVALYSWYSPSRGDNFATTDPAWVPASATDTRAPDYYFVRKEGYLYNKPLAGTLGVRSWWNPSRGDNLASSHPDWTAPINNSTRGGYAYFRTEGYLNPATTPQPGYKPEEFGFNTMTQNNRTASGSRPLLVILCEYSDVSFAAGRRGYYDNLVFGGATAGQNLRSYFSENSQGRFTWSRAAVLGPFRKQDNPSTGTNESTQAFANANPALHARTCLSLARTAGGFDYSRYTNGDGRVTADELGVIIINSAPVGAYGGQTGFAGRLDVQSGVSLDVMPSRLDDRAAFATFAHELSHQLGTIDVYGSGVNGNLSLMAGTIVGDDAGAPGSKADWPETYHLDPWHKMRLGWANPRIVSVREPGVAATLGGTDTPVLLFDPFKGRNEFFMLEFRSPNRGGSTRYDANVGGGRGLAIWHLRTNADGKLAIITKIGTGNDGRLDSVVPAGSDDYSFDASVPLDNIKDVILPGGNLVLETPRNTNDVLLADAANLILGAGSRTLGSGALWPFLDPLTGYTSRQIQPRWLDRSTSAATIDVGDVISTNNVDSGINVQVNLAWFLQQPMRIDGPTNTTPLVGQSIDIDGSFTISQNSAVVSLKLASGVIVRNLTVERWTPGRITARIPVGTPPGTYQLVVFNTQWSIASNIVMVTVR